MGYISSYYYELRKQTFAHIVKFVFCLKRAKANGGNATIDANGAYTYTATEICSVSGGSMGVLALFYLLLILGRRTAIK